MRDSAFEMAVLPSTQVCVKESVSVVGWHRGGTNYSKWQIHVAKERFQMGEKEEEKGGRRGTRERKSKREWEIQCLSFNVTSLAQDNRTTICTFPSLFEYHMMTHGHITVCCSTLRYILVLNKGSVNDDDR